MATYRNLDADAVKSVLDEYRQWGTRAFCARNGYHPRANAFVQDGTHLFHAPAVAGVAYDRQYGRPAGAPPTFNDDEAGAIAALEHIGLAIVNNLSTRPEDEIAWRQAVWRAICAYMDDAGLVKPEVLRDFGAYGGQQGIWVDKRRTEQIAPTGVAVAFKHTGLHYADEFNDREAFYHYPVTARHGLDEAEVNAAKQAAELNIPLFIIQEVGVLRRVRLGWIAGWDDASKLFLVHLDKPSPAKLLDHDRSDEEPFHLDGNRSHHKMRSTKVRPDQGRFKLQVLQRYGARCPFTGVIVPQMIEAAHLKPDSLGGSSDPRNGLPMSVAVHRAFDRHLFGINPDTLEVETVPGGYTLAQLGIINPTLSLSKNPDAQALTWRYNHWIKHR